MAKMHGIRLVLVMRLEIELLAWPPPSSLLFSPLLKPSFLLALILLWRYFDFWLCIEGVWPREIERKREILFACFLLSCSCYFLSLIFLVAWPSIMARGVVWPKCVGEGEYNCKKSFWSVL